MQRLEVSGAVRPIWVVRRQKVEKNSVTQQHSLHFDQSINHKAKCMFPIQYSV